MTHPYTITRREPSQEMCQQGQWKANEWRQFPLRISPIYAAMLAASDKPKKVLTVADIDKCARDAQITHVLSRSKSSSFEMHFARAVEAAILAKLA